MLLYLHLHANEIAPTDSFVQADYVRVVDLDIGANKSDICAVKVVTMRSAPAECCNRALV